MQMGIIFLAGLVFLSYWRNQFNGIEPTNAAFSASSSSSAENNNILSKKRKPVQ